MNLLSTIKTALIALAIGLSIGFGVGFYTKGQLFKADQLDRVVTAQHDTAKGIDQSIKQDVVITAKVEASNKKVDVIRKKVAKRIQTQEKQNEITTEVGNTCGPLYLDVGTVWLLNDARGYAPPDATAQSDAASQAPSEIGAAEFIDNDLEIIKLYRELGTDHDALVDYVESLVKKQAE